MVKQLPTPAIDGSTYVVRFAFADEDGVAVVPETLEWRLENRIGRIINDRDWDSIAPGETVDILLSGDDLYYEDGGERVVTIRGTYNSSAGSGLPLTGEARFLVTNLQGIRKEA